MHSYTFTILEILLIIAVSTITLLFSFLYSLTSLPGYPLQGTSRGSNFCVTHQGREGDTPSLVPTVKNVGHRQTTDLVGKLRSLSVNLVRSGSIQFSQYKQNFATKVLVNLARGC